MVARELDKPPLGGGRQVKPPLLGAGRMNPDLQGAGRMIWIVRVN